MCNDKASLYLQNLTSESCMASVEVRYKKNKRPFETSSRNTIKFTQLSKYCSTYSWDQNLEGSFAFIVC